MYRASYLSLLSSVASVYQTTSFLSLGGLFCTLKKHSLCINTFDVKMDAFHRKGYICDIRSQISRG